MVGTTVGNRFLSGFKTERPGQGAANGATARHDGVAVKGLRVMLDRLRDKLGSGVVVIGGVHEAKVTLLAGVTHDLVDTYHAGRLVSALAPMVSGKGGGKAEMAQGGGSDIGALDVALAAVSGKLALTE